jgi:hypothetical protein
VKRPIIVVAIATAALLAGCASAGSAAPSVSTASTAGAPSGQPSAAAGSSGPAAASADTTAQFGGDVCSALTRADIEAAKYPQGTATFDSTDTQKNDAGKAVVCQYLVVFGGKPSIVGAYVTVFDDSEAQHRQQVQLTFKPEPVSGVGTEASVIQVAPGLYEVWVTGPHGKFTVGAQDKTTAIALAELAVARD